MDDRPQRRNKPEFLNSSGIVRTGPEKSAFFPIFFKNFTDLIYQIAHEKTFYFSKI